MNKRCLLVVGSPRSGMTPMAGSLRLLGVPMGQVDISSIPQLSTFEHRDLKGIHRELLECAGASWDHPEKLPDRWDSDQNLKIYKRTITTILEKEFQKQPWFVLKELSLPLLLSIYAEVLESMSIQPLLIELERKDEEIYMSMASKFQFSREQCELIHNKYQDCISRYRQRYPSVQIKFDDLIAETLSAIDQMRHGLDLGLKGWYGPLQEVLGYIHPGLRNHTLDVSVVRKQYELLKLRNLKTEDQLFRTQHQLKRTFEYALFKGRKKLPGIAKGLWNAIIAGKRNFLEWAWSRRRRKSADAIGILGRGISLNRAASLQFLDEFIIINQFDKEMERDPVKSLLKGKRIVHVVNYAERVLPRKLLWKYHIANYQLTLREPDGTNNRLRRQREHRFPEGVGYRPKYLPDVMDTYLNPRGGYNAGTLALIYAVLALGKKRVYIAGMDFYDQNYWTDPEKVQRDIARKPKLATRAQSVKSAVAKITSNFPNVHFYFITESNFDPNLPNVTMFPSGAAFNPDMDQKREGTAKNAAEFAGARSM